MSTLADYPNLQHPNEKDRCPCGRFVPKSLECDNCGRLELCHCGNYRPIRTSREGFDGTMYFMLECECSGTGRAWVWE